MLARRELQHELVLGGQHHVRGAEQRVGPRREHAQRDAGVAGIDNEIDLGAFAPADPVALHLLRAARPIDVVEALQQCVGVLRDLQHPLAQGPAHARKAADLGLTVDDFLVRERGAELGAPPHGQLLLIRQAAVEELLHDPLRPLVVGGVRGVDLALPVVREAEPFQLLAEALDVALRRDARVGAGFQRVLLGRQAERVPAHRVQHVEAAHALVARHDVRGRVAFGMADVQPLARRVREHVEHVVLRLRGVEAVGSAKRGLALPVGLPFRFDFLERVGGHVAV